jgi:hypothetical protein
VPEPARHPADSRAGPADQGVQRGPGGRGKKLRHGIVAVLLLPERNCAGCTRQKEWGCDARQIVDEHGEEKWIDAAPIPLQIDGEEVRRCPRRPLKDDPRYWNRLLFFYGLYKQGHLPDPGAVTEQSHKAMELFQIIGDVADDCAREKAERERRKQAARGAR